MTLVLGIGATTAIFTLVYDVMLRPLPFAQPDRSFDSIAVMQEASVPLGASGRPLQVGVLSATPEIFSVLQVQPKLGRTFTPSEAHQGHEHVVILTYDVWREQFGGHPGILDKIISLNGFLTP